MKRLESAHLPTQFGDFDIIAFGTNKSDAMPHLALVSKALDVSKTIYLRMHSECMTGDVFGSVRCDCGEQLTYSMKYLAENGGILLYLRQEGRGIGLVNKLKAYNLQSEGLNTLDANTHLGFEPDERDYKAAVEILEDLGVQSVELLTNNPLKIEAIRNSSIEIVDRIPVIIEPQPDNEAYITTKQEKMGHLSS